jgi:hypothetical protein
MKVSHSYIIFYTGIKSWKQEWNGTSHGIPNEYYNGRLQLTQKRKIAGVADLAQLEKTLKDEHGWSGCNVTGVYYIGKVRVKK